MEPIQLSKDEAVAFAEGKQWEPMTLRERTEFQLFQDRLCMPFGVFHEAVEKALGRPVWTHEFADRQRLQDELRGLGPTPENPAQHALDSLTAMMVAEGKDPATQIIVMNVDRDPEEP